MISFSATYVRPRTCAAVRCNRQVGGVHDIFQFFHDFKAFLSRAWLPWPPENETKLNFSGSRAMRLPIIARSSDPRHDQPPNHSEF